MISKILFINFGIINFIKIIKFVSSRKEDKIHFISSDEIMENFIDYNYNKNILEGMKNLTKVIIFIPIIFL